MSEYRKYVVKGMNDEFQIYVRNKIIDYLNESVDGLDGATSVGQGKIVFDDRYGKMWVIEIKNAED